MTQSALAEAYALYAKGQLDAARQQAERYLKAKPGDVEALYLLGGIAFALYDAPEAERKFKAVLDQGFETAELYFNLGEALAAQHKKPEAIEFLKKAVALDAKMDAAYQRLGLYLAQGGQFTEALEHMHKAFFLKPDAATANNLAATFQKAERLEEAEAWYRQAISLDPHHAKAHDNLGGLLQLEGRLSEAIDCHKQAIVLDPAFAAARINLANAFLAEGRVSGAAGILRWALMMDKQSQTAAQNHLMCLCYDETVEGDALYREHRRFGDYQEKRITPLPATLKRTGSLPKPLRLGLVSPDFRRHSVAYFLEPLLEALDPALVQVHLYADVPNPDEVTARLKGFAHVWRDLAGLTDDQAARLVQADGIHVLIDLAGHTANNRLGLFMLAPAPVQATWLGYPATTGLSRIQWRLTDAIADPEGPADALHTEKLLRLAHDRLTPSHPSDAELNVNRSLKQIDGADSRLQSKPENGFDFRRPDLVRGKTWDGAHEQRNQRQGRRRRQG